MWNRTFRKRADGVQTLDELSQLMREAWDHSRRSGLKDKQFRFAADAIKRLVDGSQGVLETRGAFFAVARSLLGQEDNFLDLPYWIWIYVKRHGVRSLAEARDLDGNMIGASSWRLDGVRTAQEAIAKAAEPLLRIESGMSLEDITQVFLAADQLRISEGLRNTLARVAADNWVIEQFQGVFGAVEFLSRLPPWARSHILAWYVFLLDRGVKDGITPTEGRMLLGVLASGNARDTADIEPVVRGMVARWSESHPQEVAAAAVAIATGQ